MGATGLTRAQRITRHYENCWGTEISKLRWTQGPVHELPEDFHIGVYPRSVDTMAYATIGMSQDSEAGSLELFVLGRPGDPDWDIVELLTIVAHFHRTSELLALGHTVNLGKPVKPGSQLTHALVSLPYLDGPPLERLAGEPTQFLWLLPITEQEREFKRKCGLTELENRFETHSVNYLDLHRPSLV